MSTAIRSFLLLAFAAFLLLVGSAEISAQTFTWWKTASGDDRVEGRKIVAGAGGSVYIAGFAAQKDGPTRCDTVTIPSARGYSAYVVRIGPHGRAEWATGWIGETLGYALGIDADTDGNCWCAGQTRNVRFASDTAPGGYVERTVGFTTCLRPDGTRRWNLVDSSAPRSVYRDIVCDREGGAYIVGNWEGRPAPAMWLRYDSDGRLLWRRRSLGAGVVDLFAAAVDSAGELYVAGRVLDTADFGGVRLAATNGDYLAFAARIGAAGDVRWATPLGAVNEYEIVRDVEIGGGNVHVLIAPRGASSDVVVLDADGRVLRRRSVMGSYGALAAAPDGAYTLFGSLLPGTVVDTITALAFPYGGAGGTMSAAVAFTPEGRIRWLLQPAGSKQQTGEAIDLEPGGGLLVAGTFGDGNAYRPTVVFGRDTVRGSGGYSMFAARIAAVPSSIEPGGRGASRRARILAAGPAESVLAISLAAPEHLRVEIVDVIGRTVTAVAERTFEAGEVVLPLPGLARGLYFCRVVGRVVHVLPVMMH